MWPREHGTYVQLLAPLLAAWLSRSPTLASVLLSIGVCVVFLGAEAALVAQGGRGKRRQRDDGERAARRARAFGLVAATAGAAGLLVAPRSALELAALVAVPATIAMVLAAKRSIHTLHGELIAAVTLAGAAAPVAAAAGMSRTDALLVWLGWSAGFATSVIAIRRVIALHRKRGSALLGLHLACFAAVGAAMLMDARIAIALPLVVVAAVVSGLAPSAKRLMAVGIAFAITSTLSVAIAVATS